MYVFEPSSSVGGDTVGVVVVIPEVGGEGAKVADGQGGGVERSRAGDNKDKLEKDVSGEMEGGIKVVGGDSDDFFDEMAVGSREAGIGGGGMLAGW